MPAEESADCACPGPHAAPASRTSTASLAELRPDGAPGHPGDSRAAATEFARGPGRQIATASRRSTLSLVSLLPERSELGDAIATSEGGSRVGRHCDAKSRKSTLSLMSAVTRAEPGSGGRSASASPLDIA
jgi:hypothetical protein